MSLPWHRGRAWCAAIPQSVPTATPHPWRGRNSPGRASPARQLHPADNLDKPGAYPRSWRARQGEDKPCRNLQPGPSWRGAQNEILIWKELGSGSGSEEHPAAFPSASPASGLSEQPGMWIYSCGLGAAACLAALVLLGRAGFLARDHFHQEEPW